MSSTAQPPAIRVFLLDDHEVVRRGVADILSGHPDITVVGEGKNAAEAMSRVPALRPDVAILDVRLPDGDGVTVCRDLRAQLPDLGVVMLTSYSDDEALFQAILAGASGYLLKDAELLEISAAIHSVAAGLGAVAPGVAGLLLKSVRSASVRPVERTSHAAVALSPRERQVLTLLTHGCDNGDIARQLFVSPSTVKHHVSRLLDKIGASNRVQAATFAVRAGFHDD